MRNRFFGFLLLLLLGSTGCTTTKAPVGQLTQWSPYPFTEVMMETNGGIAIHDILQSGDTGIGQLRSGDGELLFHQGRAYQLRADGQVFSPSPLSPVISAAITPFRTDVAVVLPNGCDRNQLEAILAEQVPDFSRPCIIRVIGRFSVLEISAPWKDGQTGRTQVRTNHLNRVSGTLTGIRFPDGAHALHTPGLHLLFLSHDRLNGGRAGAFHLLDGTLEVHQTRRLLFFYPNAAGKAD